jgi:phosphoribosyl 1,2-cyclic phosphodiesterase
MIRFSILGSGSRGNASLVESRDTLLLLDCGFSYRELVKRMAVVGRLPQDLTAVLITHEHSDHISGLSVLAAKHALPVYMTMGTRLAMKTPLSAQSAKNLVVVRPGQAVQIGAISVMPFAVPHDAREPAQYLFSSSRRRIAFLTACGAVTPHIRDTIATPDALVIECNHDEDMLRSGSYPHSLKKRIAGGYGHLSNRETVALIQQMDHGRIQSLVGAHLSDENNCPELVRACLLERLELDPGKIHVARQNSVLPWLEIL